MKRSVWFKINTKILYLESVQICGTEWFNVKSKNPIPSEHDI